MSYKLLSYRDGRDTRAGMLVGETVYDAAKATGMPGYSSVLGILEDWAKARRELSAAAKKLETGKSRIKGKPVARTLLLAPVLYPGAIFCAGANYRDHMLEMARVSGGAPEPDPHAVGLKPWHFIKTSRSSVVGPNARVKLPPFSQKVDWEVELAAVIGRPARNVSLDK